MNAPSPDFALADPAARLAELEAELRQARTECANAQRQLGALTEHLREGLILVDDSQCIVLLNEQVGTCFNLPTPISQWVGQPIKLVGHLVREQLLDPASYDANLTQLEQQLEAGERFHLSYLRLRSGRVLERDILRVRLGEGPGWLFTYRDVTDRCRAEKQRDEQRYFYETVLDELPVEVVVLDQNFRYVYANPQARCSGSGTAWGLAYT